MLEYLNPPLPILVQSKHNMETGIYKFNRGRYKQEARDECSRQSTVIRDTIVQRPDSLIAFLLSSQNYILLIWLQTVPWFRLELLAVRVPKTFRPLASPITQLGLLQAQTYHCPQLC
jgi:hypothetical protein